MTFLLLLLSLLLGPDASGCTPTGCTPPPCNKGCGRQVVPLRTPTRQPGLIIIDGTAYQETA